MNKIQFLKLMNFPEQWINLDMYPDELADVQLSGYRSGHENASEHDRNGAFHWWLKRSPAENALVKLMFLASIDPDKHLGQDIRSHIQKAANYTSVVEAAWKPN